jgi:cysteine desulfurase/selenocysteine lyase
MTAVSPERIDHLQASSVAARPRPALRPSFDVEAVRRDFPGLDLKIHGKPLVYLDNAATAQKPRAMIERISRAYTHECANIHRGVHWLSATATQSFTHARAKVAAWINAPDADSCIFTRGATEAINLVAHSWSEQHLQAGDEVIISALEHHANIVPWQLACARHGATLRAIPMDERGALDQEAYRRLLGPKTRMVAISHMSNALGTINPVQQMVADARAVGATVLLDGAQAITHLPVDVQALGADFYVYSAHKLYGPSGVGVLWGRRELLEAMPPYQSGGDMIEVVRLEGSTFAGLPNRFEAGTPDIAGVIGFAATLDYLDTLDLAAARAHEQDLLDYGTEQLRGVPGLTLVGTAPHKAAVMSFVLERAHPHDIGTVLDMQGIAIRTGHHCAQPVMQHFGVAATARASLALYNTRAEIDALVAGLHRVTEMFRDAPAQPGPRASSGKL